MLGEDLRAWQAFAGEGARCHTIHHQAENEVPQPHDFVA
jgi:hypothetical protein